MAKTFASLFTGFGLADVAATQSGLEPIQGVEIDPVIAEVARANLKHDIRVQNILDCNPHKFDRPDVLWASPPCPSFSQAKANGKETELDQQLAIKIVDFLRVLQPPVFILENVSGYARSKSLELIEESLYALGYWIDRQILNSADYGVSQTRKRLILRAVLGGFPQPLPAPTRWIGWHEAIEDLIPTLPETQFAEWQLKRLPEEIISLILRDDAALLNTNQTERNDYYKPGTSPSYTVRTGSIGRSKAFLVDVGNTIRDCTVRGADEPSITITAEKMRRPASTPRAFIVSGQGNRLGFEDSSLTIARQTDPVFTIKASDTKRPARAWLEHGKVVAMTSRALARFQSLPDWYNLPDKNTLACKGIGNGVPCKFAEAIIRSTI